MADDKIQIDIVLDDGSVAKGFANINREASRTKGILDGAFSVFGGIQLEKAFSALTGSVTGFFTKAIDEALEGEVAVNRLASSLRSAGTFSDSAVSAFEDLAKEIQNTTKFSDDAALSASALARNFTTTNKQAADLVKAAVQLSSALGQDLETSVTQLGGTFTGTAGRLARTVPALKGLTEEALKSGAAIDVVFRRFAGSAERDIQTLSGAIALAKNQTNDFFESIGNALIKNSTFQAAFKGIESLFNGIKTALSGIGGADTKSLVDTVVITAVQGFGLLAKTLVGVITNIENVRAALLAVNQVILDMDASILGFDAALGRIANKVSLGFSDKDFNERAKAAEAARKAALDNEKAGIAAAEAGQKAAQVYDAISKEIDKYTQSVVNASNVTNAIKPVVPNFGNGRTAAVVDLKGDQERLLKIEEARDKVIDSLDQVYARITNLKTIDLSAVFEQLRLGGELVAAETLPEIGAVSNKIQQFSDDTLKSSEQMSTAIVNGLTNAAVGGIDAFVTAIVNGENAFKAFANNLLAVIGDLAKQLGGFIIAAGIAKLELFSGDPFSTIAAGVALVAIGSALSAISKKGSKGGFAGAVSPGSSITPPLTPAQPTSGVENNKPTQSVNVVIQGDYFDTEGTGIRIADILKENGFQNAVTA